MLQGMNGKLQHDEKFNSLNELFPVHDEPTMDETYVDDIAGDLLDSDMVKRARAEDLRHFHEHQVYVKVPIEECRQRTGK